MDLPRQESKVINYPYFFVCIFYFKSFLSYCVEVPALIFYLLVVFIPFVYLRSGE